MNKSESKYFNTALRMDEALIALLEVKDLKYITVKEICEKAEVNRSTFYLHYETIGDLLNETMESINRRFQSYFLQNAGDFVDKIRVQKPQDLILITQEWLQPYLRFVCDHKNIYRATFQNPKGMQVGVRYRDLKKYIIGPILCKFNLPVNYQHYYIAYYIEGIIAVIKEWLNHNCQDSIETIAAIIEECVRPSAALEERNHEN